MGASVFARSSATMLAVIAAILFLRIQFKSLQDFSLKKGGYREPRFLIATSRAASS
jgi:hypothetical protein